MHHQVSSLTSYNENNKNDNYGCKDVINDSSNNSYNSNNNNTCCCLNPASLESEIPAERGGLWEGPKTKLVTCSKINKCGGRETERSAQCMTGVPPAV